MSQSKINQTLSITIPRVFPYWANEEKIISVFHEADIGKVYKVTIRRMSFDTQKKIYIFKAIVHFSVWYDTTNAYNLQRCILGGKKKARVFNWNVFENKNPSGLSNIDKRIMRLTADTHKIQQENFQIQEENFQIQKENASLIEKTFLKQNQRIQELQDICIANGLEVPFWAITEPPSVDVSSMEILSARTAIAAAEFVLNESESETENTTTTMMEEPQETEDFIPVGRYESDNDWDNDEPYLYSYEYNQECHESMEYAY